MTLFAMLLGLALPLCGTQGAQGVPVPGPIDFGALRRPATPNTALAAPAGFSPAPDLVTPVYRLPPRALYDKARAVIGAMPRVFLQAEDDGRLQAQYVARTPWLNFPDLVALQVNPSGENASTLILWSRSVYGQSDLGTNRRRLAAWLAALDAALPGSTR